MEYTETVAVKTLKGFMQEELVTDLLKECAKMKELDHPNVLTLKGVCLDGGPAPYIIMPFIPNGNLLSYLKKHRESLVIEPNTCDAVSLLSPSTYTIVQLVSIIVVKVLLITYVGLEKIHTCTLFTCRRKFKSSC